MKEHVTNVRKLAAELGIGYEDLRTNYYPLTGFPDKTAKGWPCARIAKFIEAQKKTQVRQVRGLNNDLRRQKLTEEIKILAVTRRKAEGAVIDITDVKATLGEHAAIVRAGCDEEVERVAHRKRDAAKFEIAENMRNNILINIGKRLKESKKVKP